MLNVFAWYLALKINALTSRSLTFTNGWIRAFSPRRQKKKEKEKRPVIHDKFTIVLR